MIAADANDNNGGDDEPQNPNDGVSNSSSAPSASAPEVRNTSRARRNLIIHDNVHHQHRISPPANSPHPQRRRPKAKCNNALPLIALSLAIALTAALNFLNRGQQSVVHGDNLQLQHSHGDDNDLDLSTIIRKRSGERQRIEELEQQINELQRQNERLTYELSSVLHSSAMSKSNNIMQRSVNSFWWPSLDSSSGLLAKLSSLQNPSDCSSPRTKFMIWRSGLEPELDNRGLTAWAHTATWHMLHALTDGDQFDIHGSRVLLQDDKLWPMAKGCQHGPETRECYFEPLSKCKLSDADPITSNNATKAYILKNHNDDYDRTIRTIYTARTAWWRGTNDVYAWTGLSGGTKVNSELTLTAAMFAYYFNPKPWLREEIHKRLQVSIPVDLNPDRSIGVPIRRSDKCMGHDIEGSAAGEMVCSSLDEYLDGVKSFVAFDPSIENVIVTSEDKAACGEFVEMLKKELPALRVVVNVGDVQQGTGSGAKLESYTEGSTNAAVVASALTSMHMHMRARYFVITSVSTWTSTVTFMARAYGLATSDVFVIDLMKKNNRLASLARNGCQCKRWR